MPELQTYPIYEVQLSFVRNTEDSFLITCLFKNLTLSITLPFFCSSGLKIRIYSVLLMPVSIFLIHILYNWVSVTMNQEGTILGFKFIL